MTWVEALPLLDSGPEGPRPSQGLWFSQCFEDEEDGREEGPAQCKHRKTGVLDVLPTPKAVLIVNFLRACVWVAGAQRASRVHIPTPSQSPEPAHQP